MFTQLKSFIVIGFFLLSIIRNCQLLFTWNRQTILIRILCTLLFTISSKIIAQTQLDEIVVTANKTDQKLSQTGKVITVLTDSILQKYQGQSVAELLSKQAGFSIVGANGPLGGNQELYLRGAGTGNTLILIDGVPAYDPSYINNGFDLNMLNLSELDKIEILKGSQSSIYGSDAVAGVINIFTKKGNGKKPITGNITANAGSYGTFNNLVNLNGLVNKINYNLQYSNTQSTGFSAAYNKLNIFSNKSFENDGFNQNSFLGNIGINITKTLTVRLRGQANKYNTDIDGGPFVDEKDFASSQKQWLMGIGADLKTTKGKIVLNYQLGENNRIYLDDSTFIAPNAFDKYAIATYGGITKFGDFYWSNAFSKTFELVVGADIRKANFKQNYLSYSQYGKYEDKPIENTEAKASIYSIYATGLLKSKAFFLELGGRFNSHSIYGQNFTYSFTPSYLVGKKLKAFANVSSGFKAPSLYQIYSPFGSHFLKPETTSSSEFGLQIASKNKNSIIRLVYFNRQQSAVIFFQSLNDFPYGKYINFDKQKDTGFEIEGNTTIKKWNFWGNYSFVEGKITTDIKGKITTFNNLYRRPKSQLNIGAGYTINNKIFVATSLKSVGKRADIFFNEATFNTENATLDAYTLFDFYADFKLSKNLKANLNLKNITNQTYFDSYGYSTKKFNFMVGFTLGF